MCGRLNVVDNPAVIGLCEQLGINLQPDQIFRRFIRATDKVSIIREKDGQRRMDNATWWLLLDKSDSGFKPSKYTSFNTRYDKLNTPRSAGFKAFRETRCVIPAKGFGETEFVNKKPIHYYDFEALEGEAIAFGGLSRDWFNPNTGELATSCSVITLPPHEKIKHIHSKAMPLILPQGDGTIDAWLDSTNHNVDMFNDLLKPHLPQNLTTYPIDKPSLHNAIGDALVINMD